MQEYWTVDCQARVVSLNRQSGGALRPVAVLSGDDELQSPLLPGFSLRVSQLFFPGAF